MKKLLPVLSGLILKLGLAGVVFAQDAADRTGPMSFDNATEVEVAVGCRGGDVGATEVKLVKKWERFRCADAAILEVKPRCKGECAKKKSFYYAKQGQNGGGCLTYMNQNPSFNWTLYVTGQGAGATSCGNNDLGGNNCFEPVEYSWGCD